VVPLKAPQDMVMKKSLNVFIALLVLAFLIAPLGGNRAFCYSDEHPTKTESAPMEGQCGNCLDITINEFLFFGPISASRQIHERNFLKLLPCAHNFLSRDHASGFAHSAAVLQNPSAKNIFFSSVVLRI
jgi:hypothetical protein